MHGNRVCLSATVLLLAYSLMAVAQQSADVMVPPMVKFSGTLRDANGKGLTGVVGVTFYLYKDQQGGAPLWIETQNVQPDKNGHYSVMLGSTTSQGLSPALFASGEARWLGVQAQGQDEQPRVLLSSVPYAMKAGDAQTVGGLPASAFVLAAPSSIVGRSATSSAGRVNTPNAPVPGSITGSGTAGFLPKFTGTATIGNSAVFQSGSSPTAKIGINTSTPTANLDVNGSANVRGHISATAVVSASAVEVDAANANNGGSSPALNFGGGGEVIISNRKGSTNKFGLDFFTNFTPRLSITNAGLVAIGNRNPTHMFEVMPPSDSSLDGAIILGAAAETGAAFAAGTGLFVSGGNDTSNTVNNSGGTGGGFGGGNSTIGSGGDGITAEPGGGPLGEGFAGKFFGDIDVTGAIFATTKDFRIDHPLDPANKYLVHASVESSEMMNIYTGNVTTDAQGEATVQFPDWFEVLNTDFRYQLTVIGQFAQAIVAKKISNHQFTIRTSAPGVEVSWQVAGVRQDVYAKSHPLVVEQEKQARLRGFYIHPELYGAPQEKQIEWGRHPQLMKQMQELRQGHPPVPPVAQLDNVQASK